MQKSIEFVITLEMANIRIDQALSAIAEIGSRSQAQKLIKNNKVNIKGKFFKVSRLTAEGEVYTVELPTKKPDQPVGVEGDLNIVFQDEHLLVIDKPAGLVVHPSHGHDSDTLVNILLGNNIKLAESSEKHRPGIVHRLDKDTSGLMIVAKSQEAFEYFIQAFKNKEIKRIYWALVLGRPKLEEFSIESNLARHPKDRKMYASSDTLEGKNAISHFKFIKEIKNKYSLLECRLETGRTHQIRVHLKEKFLPIVGDQMYGNKNSKTRKISRQALHSVEVAFVHPVSGESLSFKSELPEDITVLIL